MGICVNLMDGAREVLLTCRPWGWSRASKGFTRAMNRKNIRRRRERSQGPDNIPDVKEIMGLISGDEAKLKMAAVWFCLSFLFDQIRSSSVLQPHKSLYTVTVI